MARHSRLGRALLTAVSLPLLVFLLLPSLVIVPMALTKGQIIAFPPEWISFHSFTDYLSDPDWVSSTWLSFRVALLAVLTAAIAGSTAATALHGKRFPGRALVAGAIMAPIVVPTVLLGLGDYLLLAPMQLIGSWVALGLVHGLLVTPYIFLPVQTSLTVGLNPALIRSARSLGAGRFSVARHVYWPAIRPGVLAGALFAFAVSFDEVVISLFLQGPATITLPVRMYTAVQDDLTPKIAASASLFIALAILMLLSRGLTARKAAA